MLAIQLRHCDYDKMSSQSENEPLNEQRIDTELGFTLQVIYPAFAKERGYITPSLLDDQDRLAEQYGETNVLPSFFLDANGVVQLGLFLRQDLSEPAS